MPINYENYHPEWKTRIRPAVLKRAGGSGDDPRIGVCCEQCGVENYSVGGRAKDGSFYTERQINGMKSSDGFAIFGDFPKTIKIVLTISHTDHDINNNDMSNLKALCQRCHLRHDAPHHAASRRRNKAKKVGQLMMFEVTT